MDKIAVIGAQPNERVVKSLEELLEEARSGEIISLSFIAHRRDYEVSYNTIISDGMRQSMMIGAIAFLQYKAMQKMDDEG